MLPANVLPEVLQAARRVTSNVGIFDDQVPSSAPRVPSTWKEHPISFLPSAGTGQPQVDLGGAEALTVTATSYVKHAEHFGGLLSV